jgi:hypothetical protein
MSIILLTLLRMRNAHLAAGLDNTAV